jgi:hypothetical protein
MFINTQTLAYPVTEAAIRDLNPNALWNASVADPPPPFARVTAAERPALAWDEDAIEGAPELDGADWRQTWEVETVSAEEAEARLESIKTSLSDAINRTRDERIEGGFTHNGATFQSRQSDRENIIGMGLAAVAAIGAGAQPDDLQWAIPGQDFAWITADNRLVPLDAFGMVALYQRGVAFKAAQTFYARGLKDAVLAAATPDHAQAIVDGADWPD